MAGPTVTPTSAVDLGASGLAGAVGAWLLVRTVERFSGVAPDLPWMGIALLGVLAVIVAVFALRARAGADGAGEPGDPGPALIRLALGKAALLGGVALAAGYLVFAYLFVDHLDVPALRDRVIKGVVAAALSAAVAGAGWWLERNCRGPWDSDKDMPSADGDPMDSL